MGTEADGASKRAHVLIVEDSNVLREIARRRLLDFDVQLDFAENGLQALEAYWKSRYDLILMDVQMPLMSGLEATSKIRAFESNDGRRTTIVALTASEDKEHCLAAGMDDYIAKPADYERVIQRWLPRCKKKGVDASP